MPEPTDDRELVEALRDAWVAAMEVRSRYLHRPESADETLEALDRICAELAGLVLTAEKQRARGNGPHAR